MKILIRQRPTQTASSPGTFTLAPSILKIAHRRVRVLDFDIENRPLTYLGSDFTTGEVTSIAWAWVDQPDDVTVYLLGQTDLPDILRAFCAVYDQADMVTGHYIRGHDLPMINGALVEQQMPALSSKRVQDTKVDFLRSKGVSLSQESIAGMLHLDRKKESMTQTQWRAANRLTPEGLAEVRRRVVGDVQQHIEMRQRLLELGYLGPPAMWRSGRSQIPEYTP